MGTKSEVASNWFFLVGVASAFAGLLSQCWLSPNLDEVGHLPAGCRFWIHGSASLYEVNPPLVKAVAAIPVVFSKPCYDWSALRTSPGARSEWAVGRDFVKANGYRSFWLFALARFALLPFWLVGLLATYRFARDCYGRASARFAAILWAWSPNMLAWSATICPDAAAASLGVLTTWVLWKWFRRPDWGRTIVAAIVLGLLQLSKTTWLIMYIVIPLVFFGHFRNRTKPTIKLAFILLTSVFVLNAGYSFHGTFKPLGGYKFFSKALAGPNEQGHLRMRTPSQAGNRFTGTLLANMPVPLPESYLEGIDLQKYDFEEGKWSYLRGEHKYGGWWYWYVYAAMVKLPVGLLGVFVLLLVSRLGCFGGARVETLSFALLLGIPAAILLLVSSQTGFSRYFRYILPCLPLLFVYASGLVSADYLGPRFIKHSAWVFLVCFALSSASVLPHSLSFFNCLAGGPRNGGSHLIDANIDWGQDVLALSRWVSEHPRNQPLYTSLHTFVDLPIAGIDSSPVPVDPRRIGPGVANQLRAGWYAVSVHRLNDRLRRYEYLFDFPVAHRCGYSIYIIQITEADAQRWHEQNSALR